MSKSPFIISPSLSSSDRVAAKSWPESQSFAIAREEFAYAGEHMLRKFVDFLPDIDQSAREVVHSMLVQDARDVASTLCALEKRQQRANGSFVTTIDVFSDPITHAPLFIRKPIATASQLSKKNRGLSIGGIYGFRVQSIFGRPSFRENRSTENLFMLRLLIRAFEEAVYPNYSCKFFARPWLTLDDKGQAFQVMEHLNTEIKIFDQTLPKNGRTLTQLVVNLCDAACVANVTFQCDCCANNLCFLRDASGDIYDIRSFDCDIMDSGNEGDWNELLDFTNL
ncbi:MAG: hypothetical protein LBF94_03860, partial [Puniceicoccales bacterium]|nr:hypothetical protein [Puniceicoccales bacterium]